jgi:hypothetical protein
VTANSIYGPLNFLNNFIPISTGNRFMQRITLMNIRQAKKEIIPGTLITVPIATDQPLRCLGIVADIQPIMPELIQYRFFGQIIPVEPTPDEATRLALTLPIIITFLSGYLGFKLSSWRKVGSLPNFSPVHWANRYFYSKYTHTTYDFYTGENTKSKEQDKALPEDGVAGHVFVQQILARAFDLPVMNTAVPSFEPPIAFKLDAPPNQADSIRIVNLIGNHFPKSEPLIDLQGGLLTIDTPSDLTSIAQMLREHGILGRLIKSNGAGPKQG